MRQQLKKQMEQQLKQQQLVHNVIFIILYVILSGCCIMLYLIVINGIVFGIICGFSYLLYYSQYGFLFLKGMPKTYWYYVADISIIYGILLGILFICDIVLCGVVLIMRCLNSDKIRNDVNTDSREVFINITKQAQFFETD